MKKKIIALIVLGVVVIAATAITVHIFQKTRKNYCKFN